MFKALSTDRDVFVIKDEFRFDSLEKDLSGLIGVLRSAGFYVDIKISRRVVGKRKIKVPFSWDVGLKTEGYVFCSNTGDSVIISSFGADRYGSGVERIGIDVDYSPNVHAPSEIDESADLILDALRNYYCSG